MSLRQKYLQILSGVVPAGAVGLSLLLGAATPGVAKEEPAGLQPSASEGGRVSERLAAIRQAVSDTANSEVAKGKGEDLRLAWGNWWRNWGFRPRWGFGWPNWNNWRNWNNWNNWWRNW